jgi:hypothetical protein
MANRQIQLRIDSWTRFRFEAQSSPQGFPIN